MMATGKTLTRALGENIEAGDAVEPPSTSTASRHRPVARSSLWRRVVCCRAVLTEQPKIHNRCDIATLKCIK